MSQATKLYLDAMFAGKRTHGCWICGVALRRIEATADHLVPQSQGGSDENGNLRPCCWTCNNTRGDRQLSAAEWDKAKAWQPTPEKVMKLQVWLTEPERDLVETALKSFIEEADKELVGAAGKRARGYAARRVDEILKRLVRKDGK